MNKNAFAGAASHNGYRNFFHAVSSLHHFVWIKRYRSLWKNLWSDFLLDIMGSPDERQIDGLGGGHSLTSKAAIIKKSARKDADVEYTFAQVSLTDNFT